MQSSKASPCTDFIYILCILFWDLENISTLDTWRPQCSSARLIQLTTVFTHYNMTCLFSCLFASVTPSVLPLGVITSRVRMSDLLLLKHKAASEREAANCGRAVWDPDRNCRHASGISCADALWKDEFKFGAVVPSCVQIRLTPLRLEQINTLRPEIALEANWRLRNRPKRCPAC